MAIVGELHKTQFAGGLSVIMGRSDAAGGTQAVVSGMKKVCFILHAYTESPGVVAPLHATESAGTVTFTPTTDKQFDFAIFGLL